jgi:cyanophycinase
MRIGTLRGSGIGGLALYIFLFTLTSSFAAETKVGPAAGSLLIHGGGMLTRETVEEFIRLAGGKDVPFVIIPTAESNDDWGAQYVDRSFLKRAGCKNVTVLHTRERAVADSPKFVEPLATARGVWIDGGRQWRLADAFLGTRVVVELHAVLARGGVIGGSSAGATIQGSYMVRGAPEGNHVMMAKGHEEGFAFLKNTAIDQHVIARKREGDLLPVVAARPHLLGLGLDEGTAIIVKGDRATVMGASKLLVYDFAYTPGSDGLRYFAVAAGESLDLATRRKTE